ncbi:hypothetical protein RM549_04685 [Salegentibacter sp. F188]|uniref:Uncharacterized protein n=1 Tax=Autumnicola patrickiae TaxID=3075591 RepID=A0ABU3E077_9FLAO|nr:hypothetical protein [Salegentibacter sp. F188]MDT0689069.1 hypothetical protein [Salegentibacter sp. F188]
MKNINWKKYTFEFFSIFIAVVSAFALTNWNDNRNSRTSEQKILIEIKNGIGIDTQDFEANIKGHELSLRANEIFRDLLGNKPVAQDSIDLFYISLFRDYTPLINRSGYESLKESGLKTITNDALRLEIITLYDYHYGIVEILDNVNEMQSFQNYFTPVNELLHPFMEFDDEGNLIKIEHPKALSEDQRKEILSYLWRLENNRKYKLGKYNSVLEVMDNAEKNLQREIRS